MQISIDDGGHVLALDTGMHTTRFHAMWLRDNAQDPDTRAPGNGQRLLALRDIPPETHISNAFAKDNFISITFAPEGKTIEYDAAWLLEHTYDREQEQTRGWIDSAVALWNSDLQNSVPTQTLENLEGGGAHLSDWLDQITLRGFGKVTQGPVEEGALFRVVDLFGHVRETNYGRLFDVRTEVNPTNLAFTGAGLQAHTDNPYRDPVPTVQVLYCLESSAAGGENMVVDGFACAMRLKAENPAFFDVLADYCARFEYSGERGICLTARRPLIELAPDGALIGVRFNNRSLAAVTDVPFDKMALWYSAYRRLGEIIDDPEMEVTFRLAPGEAFIVDNTRVLHARKAYSGTGKRWLQGCYADKDGLYSLRNAMRRSITGTTG